jgi:beta-N-acetylhexosaminidase
MKKLLFIVLLVLLIGCTIKEGPKPDETDQVLEPVKPEPVKPEPVEPGPVKPEPEIPEIESDPIEDLLLSMSLNEKIGQLFIIRPEGLNFDLSVKELENHNRTGISTLPQELSINLEHYPVGGYILFQKNIVDPIQLRKFQDDLAAHLSIQPFFAIDEEGGRVSRLASNAQFETVSFADMLYIDDAYTVGESIGQYLKDYGFNLNFAPVADVNSNPLNPVIGSRSFSDDPFIVAEKVKQIINGFHSQNMITTLKHFPGHGDTSEDTHFTSARSDKSLDQLKELEFIPFETGIKAGSDLVMLAHILTPLDDVPSSLSDIIVNILRTDLGFDGLIITDSLSMNAITEYYSASESALAAFETGVDILLMPSNYQEAFDAIKEAITNKTIDEEELNKRVYKILELKSKYGIISH